MSKVHIICILDRSASMGPLKNEVISGFNDFISEQQKVKGKASVTLALFNSSTSVTIKKEDLKNIKKLTSDDYVPSGMTAMYDAIGQTLDSFKKKKKAIVLIMTDGHENASGEYTSEQVRELIKSQKKAGWQFNFMGANIDAWDVGCNLGLSKSDTTQFDATTAGLKTAYRSMNVVSTQYRNSQ